jgi:ATP-binding cassette subfamily B protein
MIKFPRSFSFTRQFDQMDCGPACIRMIALYYGKDHPLSFLRSLSHLTREGVSVAGIRDALKEIGAESATYEITLDQLREKCPLPVILYWEQNHFVVLYKIKKSKRTGRSKYYIANPAYGKHAFSEESFSPFWLNGDKGIVIMIEPTEKFFACESKKEKHSLINFAQKYVWPYKWEMSQSAFGMLFGLLLSLVTPFLTQATVDYGIGMRNMGIIINILLAQIFIFVGSFSMNLIGSWVTLYMSTRISINILSDYLTKLLRLPMTFFETKSVGDYQQRLSDHGRLQGFVTYSTLQTLFSLISAPFFLAIIGWYSYVILSVFLALTGLSIVWMSWFFHKRKAIDYEQFKVNAENQNKQYELMSGITDIKLNSYEDFKLQEWRDLQERQYRMRQKGLKLEQIQNTGFSIIGQLRNIFITFWIAAEVVNGNLTLGMMMSISAIIGQVNGPLSQLISFLQQLQNAKISLERSEEVKLCHDEDSTLQTDIPADYPRDIEVSNLSFSYTGSIGKFALKGIYLSIPAGKMTAIVGESGSGKTTLMKLLLKFYEPTSGEILLGGQNLSNFKAKSIRNVSGIVMQDNFIFSDTVKRNIILGETIDEIRLRESIEAACLTDYIESQPLGVETKIGSNGIGISGGEKQRVMIARAVYKEPLYLMLDEATSSLDAENERKITENLDKHFFNRTRIIIAHRLSTVKNADNIVVLRKGQVVEQGTHSILVEKRGYYYELIHNQLELAD